MVPLLLLVCISLVHSRPSSDLSSEASQHKFANFPIRPPNEESSPVLPEVARPARQVESGLPLPEPQSNYHFDLSEDSLGLISGPRASRQVQTPVVYQEEAASFSPQERAGHEAVDDFDYYTPEALEETVRHERDGGSHGRSRAGRQQGRRPAPPQVDYDDYDYQQEQEPRGGRQTGEVGVALGVLNSPPSADGRYNFNFSNDDGSFREETRDSAGTVAGSYGFISPNGEQTQVQYTADENGYHVSGLPCPPHVLRLLQHLSKINGGPVSC